MIIKLKSFVTAILSTILMCCSNHVNLSTDAQKETQIPESYLDIAGESNSIANKIESSIACISKSGKYSYPEYFGGLYIDSDGYLVVLLKGDMASSRSKIDSISDSELIRFKPCKYSYQELLNATSQIDTALSTVPKELIENFAGYALMTEENVVTVILEDNSQSAMTEFRQNIFDSPCLTFIKGKKIINH